MKRIIAVLLTLMMALSLTACSGDDNAKVAGTFSDDSCAEYTLSGGTMQWTGGSYELFDNLDDLHVKLPVQWVKQ